MSHPATTFDFKGLTFTFVNGRIFLDDERVSYRDFILFARGKIDLAPKPSIVDIVVQTSGASGLDSDGGDFDILRDALAATGLTETLADRGADFTVFAPTDAAFIQLARDLGATVEDGDEQATVDAILATLGDLAGGDPTDLLRDILLYHVSPNGRSLAELQADGAIATVQGGVLDLRGVDLVDGEPDVANPKIVSPDIEAKNGTIQVIDRVLIPLDLMGNDQPNVVTIAEDNGSFTILLKALGVAGLVETVTNLDDFTVFAPTDAAFTQLAVDLGFGGDQSDLDTVFDYLVDQLDGLSGGDPIGLLTDILFYHVSLGAKSAAAIDALPEIETLLPGATFEAEGLELVDNEPDIDNPTIVIPDIIAGNGTIQAIDRVLIPLNIPGNTVGQVIEGTNKRDHLTGTDGDDQLFGFRGRDVLEGGLGDDHLTGGKGRDFFDFRDLQGDDTVKDFTKRDKLVLDRHEFANVHQVFAALEEKDGDVVITGANGSITLEHVDADDLGSKSFLFY